MCNLQIRHEVSFKNVTHKICSDACFNRYRMANGLVMNCCEQCGNYLPNRATANHYLLVDGQQKRFCTQNCIRDYKQVSLPVWLAGSERAGLSQVDINLLNGETQWEYMLPKGQGSPDINPCSGIDMVISALG